MHDAMLFGIDIPSNVYNVQDRVPFGLVSSSKYFILNSAPYSDVFNRENIPLVPYLRGSNFVKST
jgi:hypothetical protein